MPIFTVERKTQLDLKRCPVKGAEYSMYGWLTQLNSVGGCELITTGVSPSIGEWLAGLKESCDESDLSSPRVILKTRVRYYLTHEVYLPLLSIEKVKHASSNIPMVSATESMRIQSIYLVDATSRLDQPRALGLRSRFVYAFFTSLSCCKDSNAAAICSSNSHWTCRVTFVCTISGEERTLRYEYQ